MALEIERLSVGALWREPGGRAPLLGILEERQKRLWRCASLSIAASLGNLEGGSSTGEFESWMKGVLRMERFCLNRLSAEGQWKIY